MAQAQEDSQTGIQGITAEPNQNVVPSFLHGDWGTPGQCTAQQEAGSEETVDHVRDSPYRFNPQWVSRWFHYCRVTRVVPTGEGFRARVTCGEDAIERPWDIDILQGATQEGRDTIAMSWSSFDPDDPVTEPWNVGPLQRCEAPQS
ncbi:MAG: hypothetical protein AAF590_02265 [Pseudomonadota bacterium]